jgi:Transposase DDE domain group 1
MLSPAIAVQRGGRLSRCEAAARQRAQRRGLGGSTSARDRATNLETPSRAVVRFYNKRGTAEQWIKEGKQAVKMTRLSCHRFRSNQVRLALSLLAYNLGNLWRRLTLPRRIENWTLTGLQQWLVKTGGRLVKHARYYWLLLAEGHLNRRRFGAMLGRIALLQIPT